MYDDVIGWEHVTRYWPFVLGIHRSPVNSPHKGQWHGALMFSLICAWLNGWVNNREAGDLRRHRTHYDVMVLRTNNHKAWSTNADCRSWESLYKEIHGNRFNPLFSIYSPAIACHHQIIALMLRIITPCMLIRNITRKCKKYNFPFHLSVMKHDSTPNHISCQLLSRDLCICLIYELDIWYYFIYGNQKAVWNYILCNKSLNEMIYMQELIPHINRFING